MTSQRAAAQDEWLARSLARIIWRRGSSGMRGSSRGCVSYVLAVSCLVGVTFWLFTTPTSYPLSEREDVLLLLLFKTLSATERLVEYYFTVTDEVNLDSCFGTHLSEGQLAAFLEHLQNTGVAAHRQRIVPRLAEVISRLHRLRKRLKDFTDEAIPHIQKNQPDYFHYLGFLLTGNWNLFFASRDIDRTLVKPYARLEIKERLKENESDTCLREPFARKCSPSSMCWGLVTTTGFTGYSLTHQLLYFLNFRSVGCQEQLEATAQKWSKQSADSQVAYLCAAILNEAELIAKRRYPTYRRDLFMEQIALCAVAGFRDFTRHDWLLEILSWQNSSGCYTFEKEVLDRDVETDFGISLVKYKTDRGNRHLKINSRKKREEKEHKDGCYSHVTAVALNALGQYLRYLTEELLE